MMLFLDMTPSMITRCGIHSIIVNFPLISNIRTWICQKLESHFMIHLLQNDTTYFGAVVGRVANRIGGANFTLNGVLYKTVANDGKNTLHGKAFFFFHQF